MKKQLISPQILGHLDFSLPFTLNTDASDGGLGAVLTEQTGQGTEKVLAFASWILCQAERIYSTTEQECFTVVWALKNWRYYLEGRDFTVVTGHSLLVYGFNTQKPSTQLIWWTLCLQEFSFSAECREGKYKCLLPCHEHQLTIINQPPVQLCCSPSKIPLNHSKLRMRTSGKHDGRIFKACTKKIMETGEVLENATTKFTVLEDKADGVDDLPHKTLFQVCPFLPLPTTPTTSHHGRYKTYKWLQALVYWP